MMLVLCDYINADDMAWPGSSVLAEDVGVDARTIGRHLSRLDGQGVVRRHQRWGERGRRGRSSDEIEFVWEGFQRLPLVRSPRSGSAELPDKMSANPGGLSDTDGAFTGHSDGAFTGHSENRSSYRTPQVEPPKNPLAESFDRFWSIYPRKAAKPDARKAWAKLTPDQRESAILGAERFKADPNRDPEFTPYPATWLRGERWDDDPLPVRGGQAVARPRAWDAIAELRRMSGEDDRSPEADGLLGGSLADVPDDPGDDPGMGRALGTG